MYIRWKEQPREPQWGYDEHHIWRSGVTYKSVLYSAYLVESKRINGKPRQKATYLACINNKHLSSDAVGRQAHFWKNVLAKLKDMQITAEQKLSIENALLKRVPRPSDEAIAKSEQEYQAFMAAMSARLKDLKRM